MLSECGCLKKKKEGEKKDICVGHSERMMGDDESASVVFFFPPAHEHTNTQWRTKI